MYKSDRNMWQNHYTMKKVTLTYNQCRITHNVSPNHLQKYVLNPYKTVRNIG